MPAFDQRMLWGASVKPSGSGAPSELARFTSTPVGFASELPEGEGWPLGDGPWAFASEQWGNPSELVRRGRRRPASPGAQQLLPAGVISGDHNPTRGPCGPVRGLEHSYNATEKRFLNLDNAVVASSAEALWPYSGFQIGFVFVSPSAQNAKLCFIQKRWSCWGATTNGPPSGAFAVFQAVPTGNPPATRPRGAME